jgi:hypothetical protein
MVKNMTHRRRQHRKSRFYKLSAYFAVVAIILQAIYPIIPFLPSFKLFQKNVASANDDILATGEKDKVMFENSNPEFKVDFGNKEQQDQPFVRFQAQGSNDNPFAKAKNESIVQNVYERLSSAVFGEKQLGVEMSLVEAGVDLGKAGSPENIQSAGNWEKGTDQSNSNNEVNVTGDPPVKPEDDKGATDQAVLEAQAELQAEQQIAAELNDQLDKMIKDIDYRPEKTGDVNKQREELKEQILANLISEKQTEASTEVVQLDKLTEKNVKQDVVKNTDIVPGIDAQYRIMEGKGMKEEFLIKENEGFSQDCAVKETDSGEAKMENGDGKECSLPKNIFTYELKLDPGVQMHQAIGATNSQPHGITYFTDEKGKYLFHFLPLFATDGTGAKTNNVRLEIEPSGMPQDNDSGRYTMKVIVDLTWLLSPNRVYPVRVDPSIVHDTKAEFDAGNSLNRLESLADPKVDIKNPNGGNDAYTKLLLHADGSNGSTTFTDSEMNATQKKTVTANGNARIATAQSEFGGSSAYFDGTGDYLSLPNNSDFNFGTGDYTIDAWIYPTSAGSPQYQFIFGGASGELTLCLDGTSLELGKWYVAGIAYSAAGSVTSNTWQHVAVTRSGTTVKLFVNGIKVGDATDATNVTYAGQPRVGASSYSTNYAYFNGYIDELRVTKGAARWTGNFTPPSYPYDFSKRSGQYDSSVLDLSSNASSIDSLQWTENGVRTGDGGTPYSTANLEAQWNFDETSGSTADNSAGGASCGGTDSNCDLSSGVISTAGQDVSPVTGWTSVNKRWGAGGIMVDAYDRLRVHCDGINNSTKFFDSATNKAITANGDVKVSNTQTNFENSCYFDGAGDYLSAADSDDFYFINWAFTADFWVNFADLTNTQVFLGQYADASNYWQIKKDTNANGNKISVNFVSAGSTKANYVMTNSWAASTNTWYHVAVARRDSGIVIFIDGTSQTLTANTAISSNNVGNVAAPLWIGGLNSANYLNGYLDEIRISTGIARWTSNFTRPDRPYFFSAANPASNGIDPNSSDLSIETWIKTSSTSTELLSNNNGNGTSCTNNGYYLGIDSSGYPVFNLDTNGDTAGCDVGITGTASVNDGNWHLLTAVVTRGTGAVIYLDGVAVGTDASVTSYSSITVDGRAFFGGNGVIADSTRIYSRALSATEVLSNYQVGNIEFETRTGADSTPDDGSWEDWKPTSTEAQIDSMDTDSANWEGNGNYTKLLLHANGANASTTFTDNSFPSKTITAGGSAVVSTTQSNFGGSSAYFNGVGAYLYASDSDDFSFGTGNFTLDFWVRFADLTNSETFMGQYADASNSWVIKKDTNANGNKLSLYFRSGGSDKADYVMTNSWSGAAIDTWYHLAFVRSGTNVYIFINGTIQALTANTAISTNDLGNVASNLNVGVLTPAMGNWLNGYLDEVRVSKGVARWTSAFTAPTAEYINPGRIYTSDVANPKAEGTGSMKATIGAPQVDANTVGLWHMEETGGSSAYIKDATANANNGTPTSTTVAEGVYGKARLFDDSDDYINIDDNNALDITAGTSGTVEAWIKPNANEADNWFLCKSSNYCLGINASGAFLFTGGSAQDNGGTSLLAGNWYHVAVTDNGTTATYYINGASAGTDTVNWGSTYTNALRIGRDGGSNYFDGYVDEVKISNVVRSAEEIYEDYRMGRDHRTSRSISTTNLSSKTKLPFWVAGDRVGSYLEATVGESAYANYEPDANTVGLYHLEEQSGTGAYIKDSSSYGNSATPTSATFVDGKIGKARSFSGSGQYITLPTSSASWNFGTGDFTIDAWIYPRSLGAIGAEYHAIFGGANGEFIFDTDGNLLEAGRWQIAGMIGTNRGVLTTNSWQHVAVTRSGTTISLYVNGVKQAQNTDSTNITFAGSPRIGATSYASNYAYFNGNIDEVRVSKGIARSSDDIRQAFEAGRHTHPISIDFQAKLDAGNLITDSNDKSFTTDDTSYLSISNKADTLYIGDKVIVKENYNGTEYIAQGTVDSVNQTTGATTVSSWDAGSTFPSGGQTGFSANASVFKWQKEWVDVTTPLSTHVDGVTRLTLRCTDGSAGENVYLDDFRSGGPYITAPAATSNVTSTIQRYMQYRAIFSTTDTAMTPYLSGVTVNYTTGPTMAQVMRHGKYWSGNVKQIFWWAR